MHLYSRNSNTNGEVEVEGNGVRLSVKVALQGGNGSECVESRELDITCQFLSEVHGRVTRVKWFWHSLKQVEMVKDLGQGEVRVALHFNTLRRGREYVMSLASYSTLLSFYKQQQEAVKQALGSSHKMLHCVG